MGYSGAGGKLIHKKNQKQQISWHCPFKEAFPFQRHLAGFYCIDVSLEAKGTRRGKLSRPLLL